MNTEQQNEAMTCTDKEAQTPFPEHEEAATLLSYYRQMVLVRRFEEKAAEMYSRARIGGYCHLNLGEEATVVGFCTAVEPTDYVYATYREHGYAINRGIAPKVVMAELFCEG